MNRFEQPTVGLAAKLRAPLASIVAVTLVLATGSGGQEMPMPVPLQWALLSKVLTYDRNLVGTDGEVALGVIYQPQVRRSLRAKNEFMTAIDEFDQTHSLRFSCTPIPFTSVADLGAALDSVHVLYITPMRSVDLAAIASESRERRKLTVTGVPAYLESGVAVGVDLQGKKPRIIVNLTSARAAGADFQSRLLQLAKIID